VPLIPYSAWVNELMCELLYRMLGNAGSIEFGFVVVKVRNEQNMKGQDWQQVLFGNLLLNVRHSPFDGLCSPLSMLRSQL